MAVTCAGEFKDAQPEVPTVKGVTLQGGPQMIQLRCACSLKSLPAVHLEGLNP